MPIYTHKNQEIQFPKDSEFFISIAKIGFHSFLMLGVMEVDTPKILARIGKLALETAAYKLVGKAVCKFAKARIMDEGIGRKETYSPSMSYQAYSITLKQYHEFLELIAKIEHDQKHNLNTYIPIMCYVPDMSSGEQITFRYQEIDPLVPKNNESKMEAISIHANEIKLTNNCRSTAREIMEYILAGVAERISAFFGFELNYQSTLPAGQPDKSTFYVLPPPPASSVRASDPKIGMVLEKLYAKLEKIPKVSTDSIATRKKFNAIKSLYKQLAGNQKALTAAELLTTISEYCRNHQEDLYAHRENGLKKFLGWETDTRLLFRTITNLLNEIEVKETQCKTSMTLI